MDSHVIAQIANRALSLSERLRAVAHDDTTALWEAPDEWKREAFHDEESFHRYLAAHGTTEGDVARALARRASTPTTELPDWTRDLVQVITSAHEVNDDEAVVFGLPCAPAPFSGLTSRFTGPAMREMRRALRDSVDFPAPGSRLERDLRSSLATRILALSLRTLVTELHRARESGELRGDTPEARYADFDQRLLADPAYLTRLFTDYPVLARLLVRARRDWLRHATELFTRLDSDRAELAARGWITGPKTPMVSLSMDSGDTHDEGRTVAIGAFACGGRVVYKPRSTGMDTLYERAAHHLNERATRPLVRAPGVVDRGGYGWTEFVEHSACPPEDLAKHYRGVGAALALTHALGANDIHMENAVASGIHSVVVDLEALLQNREVADPSASAFARARDLLNRSVLGVGFLPMRSGNGQGGTTADISVVAGGLESVEITVPTLVDYSTDRMSVGQGTGRMRPSANLPGDPQGLRPEHHTEDIVDGFTRARGLISADPDGFISALGHLSWLRARHLLRPTRLYGRLLYESTHPRHLGDGVDREHLFDRLWATTSGQPTVRAGVASEIRQLLRHDVPRFDASVEGISLLDGEGVVDEAYFTATAASALRERVAGMDEPDLIRQVSTIREAMSTLAADGHGRGRLQPVALTPGPEPEALRERALAAARTVLARLDASRVDGSSGRDCTWIGISPASFSGAGFEYRPLSPMLFEGLSGLTLTHVGAALALGSPDAPDPALLDTAWLCARPVMAFVEDTNAGAAPVSDAMGAYSGYAGALYALAHLSAAVGGDSRIDRLLKGGVDTIVRLAERDTYHDLAAGASGAAVVCLRLFEYTGDERTLTAALRVARIVAGRGQEDGEALGWPTDIDGGVLGGFAHGASGIGWALVEVGAAGGDDTLMEAGLRALAVDRKNFNPDVGSWPDLRREVRGQAAFPVQWCHGALGIGLSRELAHRVVPDSDLAAEAELAVEVALDRGVPPNDSLCHGTLGAREFLSLMSGHSARARAALGQLDRTILERFEQGKAEDGIAGTRAPSPGLMLGSAGFVLGLLRMAEPAVVPSVLHLEGPRQR
ncbi:type 2 lanthipeptide synthetase LanM family protein [Nocardiopsis sp. YSL2]|uniref:type 2 lanthipeptide synthetase LanM family protein n=1 Tax=Nocardiopsis sp. YSL2 TaxID=2939492 RepID=UPI0026F43826|nr:type 2 lanthipeptide synthetase LanM family protein [Nocardiopsis sp. YSL2]